jgi:hypothetical protein
MKRKKTNLEKLAELPPNLAKLALANAKKAKEGFYKTAQNGPCSSLDEAIEESFSWSDSKEGYDFWEGLFYTVRGHYSSKKITSFVLGPDVSHSVMLINNNLHVGCQKYSISEVKKLLEKLGKGLDMNHGEFQWDGEYIYTKAGDLPIEDAKKIKTWLKRRKII